MMGLDLIVDGSSEIDLDASTAVLKGEARGRVDRESVDGLR